MPQIILVHYVKLATQSIEISADGSDLRYLNPVTDVEVVSDIISIHVLQGLLASHEQFKAGLVTAGAEVTAIGHLYDQIDSECQCLGNASRKNNPYTTLDAQVSHRIKAYGYQMIRI